MSEDKHHVWITDPDTDDEVLDEPEYPAVYTVRPVLDEEGVDVVAFEAEVETDGYFPTTLAVVYTSSWTSPEDALAALKRLCELHAGAHVSR